MTDFFTLPPTWSTDSINHFRYIYTCPQDDKYTVQITLTDVYYNLNFPGDDYTYGFRAIVPVTLYLYIDNVFIAAITKSTILNIPHTKGTHCISFGVSVDRTKNNNGTQSRYRHKNPTINPSVTVDVLGASTTPYLTNPLNFLVIEKTKEDYYQQEQPLPTSTQFTNRGTYVFTATGTRAVLTMAGAVASTRTTSTASSFIGNNVNLVANGAGVSKTENSQIHIFQPSNKYHEIDDIAAESMMYGITGNYKENKDNLVFFSQVYQKGLIAGSDSSEFQFNYVTNPKTPIFNVSSRYGNADIGSPVKVQFAGIPSFSPNVSSSNPGGYAREFTRDWSLSVNYPSILTQEVTLVPGQTYTVTVGACPDMADGQTIIYPSGKENITLKCINQSVFDGFVSIQEYK